MCNLILERHIGILWYLEILLEPGKTTKNGVFEQLRANLFLAA